MKEPLARTTVSLRKSFYEKVSEEAKNNELSFSAYVRVALQEKMKRAEELKKPYDPVLENR